VTAEVVNVTNSFAHIIESPLKFYHGAACMLFTPLAMGIVHLRLFGQSCCDRAGVVKNVGLSVNWSRVARTQFAVSNSISEDIFGQ